MQAIKKTLDTKLCLFVFSFVFCYSAVSGADPEQLVLSIDTGLGVLSNLGDDSLSDVTIDYTQLGLEAGYMLCDSDQLSVLIQGSASGISALVKGKKFGVFDPILSAFWHHYFKTGSSWLEFETILGLGLGIGMAPAPEDGVLTGPVFLHAGGGVVFFPYDWFGIGLNVRARVGIPAHIPWVAGMISTSFQFRFDL